MSVWGANSGSSIFFLLLYKVDHYYLHFAIEEPEFWGNFNFPEVKKLSVSPQFKFQVNLPLKRIFLTIRTVVLKLFEDGFTTLNITGEPKEL